MAALEHPLLEGGVTYKQGPYVFVQIYTISYLFISLCVIRTRG